MVAVACGGDPGARLAERLGMKTSGNSLLRLVRRSVLSNPAPPRAIGVDDWAYRRGQRYGTLICDLETHRPIDLLPDRSADSFHAWLIQRPGIAVVARDRGEYYAHGATSGAPQAIQVADRWHLLRNISDAIKRLVDRHPRQIAEAWQSSCRPASFAGDVAPENRQVLSPSPADISQFPRDAPRRARYEQVRSLHEQEKSQRAIARELGVDRETVRRYLQADSFPERARSARHTPLDPFQEMLWQHWQGGRRNAGELHRELVSAGFSGSYYMIVRCLRRWRQDLSATASDSAPQVRPLMRRPSAHRMAWLLTRTAAELSTEESAMIKTLQAVCPEIAVARTLGVQFVDMVRNRQSDPFDAWLTAAIAADSPREIKGFARSLQKDLAAVRAALELPWSNGQTEGHVHRLKALKRQMYGRAGFDLLRIRMLNAA